MPDKQITELPAASAVNDETLIPVFVPGSSTPAQALAGKLFRAFAEAAAKNQADKAEEAAGRAETAAIRQPYSSAETGTWWVWYADGGKYVDTGVSASGSAGFSPTVKVTKENGVATITITTAAGDTVIKIQDGGDGVGIESIALKSSDAAGNTYAVALSNGTSYEITAPAGPKGDPFTYADFTPEQLAALKGAKGDAFTYSDFTPEQLAALKGEKGDAFAYEDFTAEQLAALRGPTGASIQSIERTAGNGAPGTTDTYTVTLTDGRTTTFLVYNGKDGTGAGDMTASVYDPQGKKQDIYAYTDNAVAAAKGAANGYTDQQIAAIPTPDVSGQINTHNTSEDAHADLFAAKADLINGVVPVSQLPNEVKECRIVDNIADRDAITDKFANLNVYVKDATGDSTVNTGGAYYLYDGAGWIKTGESESMDVMLSWGNVTDKPTIPTNTSQLANDSGYIKGTDVVAGDLGNYFNNPYVIQARVNDTRFDNPMPVDLPQNIIKYEFKAQSFVGLPDVATPFATIFSIKQWCDASGGVPMRIAFTQDGAIYMQMSNSDFTAWGDWQRITMYAAEKEAVASLAEHLANSDIHVTAEDKENWDAKLSKTLAAGEGVTFQTSGTSKSRFFTLEAVPNWVGWTLNAQFTSSGWVLDDPTLYGWFFKMDSRSAMTEFAVYAIPPGEGAHTDEYAVFTVKSDGSIPFVGPVYAASGQQAPATSLLRNSKLVSEDTTPSNNGEIFWTYG